MSGFNDALDFIYVCMNIRTCYGGLVEDLIYSQLAYYLGTLSLFNVSFLFFFYPWII